MEWYFRAIDASEALSARQAFVAFLRESCTPESDWGAAEVVFGELVTNVILHATGSIEIIVQASNGVVTLDVCDAGPSFSAVPSLPPTGELRGRGLYMVSRLSEKLTFERLESGNRVSVVLPVTAAQAPF